MKKLLFLIKFGLKKRIARKSFLIANIVIAVLMIALINLPTIINLFTPNTTVDETISVKIYVEEELNYDGIVEIISDKLNEGLPFDVFIVQEIDSINETVVDRFWNNSDDVLIHLKGTTNEPNITLYNKQESLQTLITEAVQLCIVEQQLGSYPHLSIEIGVNPNAEGVFDDFVSSISSLLVLPLFLLITMATQFVGVDIIEEKSTKAIETIIASVPSKTHFLSKIISSILFVLIQALIIVFIAIIGALLGNLINPQPQAGSEQLLALVGQAIPNWPILILFTFIFIITGTLMYLIIAALFASMAVTQEDYQQFQTPLMMILMIGLYISMFAPMLGSSMIMKVFTFIPIFTPIVAPIAIMMGAITWVEALIASVLLMIFDYILIVIVSPVYRVAILSYDQTKFFTRVKTIFKKARTGKPTIK